MDSLSVFLCHNARWGNFPLRRSKFTQPPTQLSACWLNVSSLAKGKTKDFSLSNRFSFSLFPFLWAHAALVDFWAKECQCLAEGFSSSGHNQQLLWHSKTTNFDFQPRIFQCQHHQPSALRSPLALWWHWHWHCQNCFTVFQLWLKIWPPPPVLPQNEDDIRDHGPEHCQSHAPQATQTQPNSTPCYFWCHCFTDWAIQQQCLRLDLATQKQCLCKSALQREPLI